MRLIDKASAKQLKYAMKMPVFSGDAYSTPEARAPLFSRMAPSLSYYSKVIGTVIRAGRLANSGRYSTEIWKGHSAEIFNHVEAVGGRIFITGLDNMRSLKSPCVFIANHMSTLETMLLPIMILNCGVNVTFVVKQSLLDYPFMGAVLGAVKPIPVSRTNPREDLKAVLEGGSAELAGGRSVIIFPQHTRSDRLDEKQFNTIGIKLALKAKAPVIPVAIKTDFWGTGRIIKDLGPVYPKKDVRFAFGPAMEVRDRGNDEHRAVIEFISSHHRKWGLLD